MKEINNQIEKENEKLRSEIKTKEMKYSEERQTTLKTIDDYKNKISIKNKEIEQIKEATEQMISLKNNEIQQLQIENKLIKNQIDQKEKENNILRTELKLKGNKYSE